MTISPRDKTRDTLNYFQSPYTNSDNKFILDGTIQISGTSFTAAEFLNAVQTSAGTAQFNPTDGFVPIRQSGAFADSSISQDNGQTIFDEPCLFVPSEVRIGSTGLRTIGDVVYLQSSRTGRQFIPVGSLFTSGGTSGFMGVELGALADQVNGSQLVSSDQMSLPIGGTFSFLFPGQPNTDYLLGEAVIRVSGAPQVRLQLFIGTDETGDLVIDQEFNLSDGDNTLSFNSIPFITEGQNYFAKYTAITSATILGSGTGAAFRPYFSARGWPYSEVTFYPTDDTATDDEHTLSAQQIYSEIDTRIQTAIDNLTPNLPMPGFTSFTIDISSPVANNTLITGSHTFTWSIENAQNIKPSTFLTISETLPGQSKSTISASVDPSLTTIDLVVSDVTLNEGDEVVYTIEGTNNQDGVFSRTTNVEVLSPHEFAYYWVAASDNSASFDTTDPSVTAVDVTTIGTSFEINTSIPNNSWLNIIVPANRPITNIQELTFNQPATSDFTQASDVRQINGQNFDSAVHQNQSGFAGTVSFRVDTGS